MKYFNLPDLGEGLPEAEIVEWHVQPGDQVDVDQLLVSVETAKAVVEVPSPVAGTILALFGKAGDVINTGEPLVEFAQGDAANAKPAAPAESDVPSSSASASTSASPTEKAERSDEGTVVGKLETAAKTSASDPFIIGAAPSSRDARHGLATPAIRALAQRLEVDLETVTGSGPQGHITAQDLERAHTDKSRHGEPEMLRGVRRTMAKIMSLSHAEVVPVTIVDDVDIEHWPANIDITIVLVRAIAQAARKEPAMNGWFYGDTLSRRLRQQVDIGIAVDTEEGLFVPVLRNVGERAPEDLRAGLNALREDVLNRSIPPAEMQGATITLSNYGTIAGRYANPIVVPPQIAIVGAGAIRKEVVANDGGIAVHRVLPLSLTFDHRAATGGEAARFLKALMAALSSDQQDKN